jgi:hypothetical protein
MKIKQSKGAGLAQQNGLSTTFLNQMLTLAKDIRKA